MFTPKHFIWLALCATAIALGLMAARKKNLTLRQAGMCMTVICFLSESCKMMTHMIPSPFGGSVLDPQALPFHLCSMQIFVVLFITFAKDSPVKKKVMEFFVPTALLGGIAAMLIPTDGVEFSDILPYQCFVYHAGLVWLAVYLLQSGKLDMGFSTYLRNLGILLALVAAMLYVNGALSAYGTNFMFVVRPPLEGLPLLNLDHGWYVYFLTLLGLGLLFFTLFHLPFLLRGKKRA